MTNPVTPTAATFEPWKRTARTVIAIVVAVATALPWIIATIQGTVGVSDGFTAALTQIGLVAAAVTRFAASPLGNTVFGWLGLDAAPVTPPQA